MAGQQSEVASVLQWPGSPGGVLCLGVSTRSCTCKIGSDDAKIGQVQSFSYVTLAAEASKGGV